MSDGPKNTLPRATHVLIVCVGVLLGLGMVSLYSASMTLRGTQLLAQQAIWCVLGLAAALFCASRDYHVWRRWAVVLAVLAVIGLLLVFVPGLGKVIKGARRWINLGPVNFQPSELAKIAGIVVLAAYAHVHQRRMHRFKQGLVLPGLFIGLVAVLIFLGRDYGTTLLFIAVCGAILLVAGVRWWQMALVGVVLATLFTAAVMTNEVRRDRILAYLHPERYPEKSYQNQQAMLAFGVGGLEGRGLGNGRQKTFVPDVHTDFVLTTVGEELGLAGSMAVVVAFMSLVICGLAIAERAPDLFGFYLAFGITTLIGLQAFVNIGVVTGFLPNKGLPLPFMSYGGSNLLLMMAAVGMLLSVARQGVERERRAENPFHAQPVAQEEVS